MWKNKFAMQKSKSVFKVNIQCYFFCSRRRSEYKEKKKKKSEMRLNTLIWHTWEETNLF